jgi:F-type H+-transporting ATPase subunit a
LEKPTTTKIQVYLSLLGAELKKDGAFMSYDDVFLFFSHTSPSFCTPVQRELMRIGIEQIVKQSPYINLIDNGSGNLLKRKLVPWEQIAPFFEEPERKWQKCFNEFKDRIQLCDGYEWGGPGQADIVRPSSSGSCPSVNQPGPLTQDFLSDAGSTNYLAPSPLDQFSIHPILDLHMGNYYFSFTNPSLSMLLTLGLVLLLLFVITKKGGGKSVPNAWQSLVELIYDFVPNLVNEQIGGISGNVKQKFFPCISVTFTFSLFRNPQGMIPFSFTVTSHFLITLALSFSIFIGITIVGFQRHGLHFFSFLLPAGVPLPLAPFLVLLELISHCFRALSSGIRLFANMMAGHSSVKILSGFAWTMLFLNNIFYFIGDLGPLFIVLALTGLELGVAISQAHVSTISICIYLNDATNLHQNE